MCQTPKFLPTDFQNRMKNFPRLDAGAFFASYSRPAFRGVLRNPLKATEETLFCSVGRFAPDTPFGPNTYYLPEDAEGDRQTTAAPCRRLLCSGALRASAVSVLAPEPGERVLDLCAAPGGKSAQIAGLLQGLRIAVV